MLLGVISGYRGSESKVITKYSKWDFVLPGSTTAQRGSRQDHDANYLTPGPKALQAYQSISPSSSASSIQTVLGEPSYVEQLDHGGYDYCYYYTDGCIDITFANDQALSIAMFGVPISGYDRQTHPDVRIR
jgi:hypothetical protein